MRADLELIEIIEQYLTGRLSDVDKAAFEKQIANDPALQQEVSLQQELMNGIERASIKLKIQAAKKKFNWSRNFRNWGLGGLSVAVVITAAVLYFTSKSNESGNYQATSLPEFNEQGEKQWVDADKNIPAQQFNIDASKDTVIQTKGGIVFAIAANSFLYENGKPVAGNVQLVVKEALDATTIMRAGLSTMSGDRLLETGGMFLIDARKDGKVLLIDSTKGIYAEIPTDTVKPGMQLFKGERKPDGTIDWVNPKPLLHDLVKTDIQQLNFYPPVYLPALHARGYNIHSKKFTDSLYYSLASYYSTEYTIELSESTIIDTTQNPDKAEQYKPADSARGSYTPDKSSDHFKCGINPAKIKAIKTKEFQNTFIATHEFEERLAAIHNSQKPELLELYLNNLDKSLYEIDSMAVIRLKAPEANQFRTFMSRHDGKVRNGSTQFELLKKHYDEKTREFTEAITKAQNAFWNEQYRLDSIADSKKESRNSESIARDIKNFTDELAINMNEAYRQLGYNTYSVHVKSTGWYNVDKYVIDATVSRTTLDYTDPLTGKKAVIKYLPVSIQISQWKEYDQLYVYLLPNKLNSFMRMNGENGKYAEKLNELMKYRLVCIAYKDEQAYFYSKDNIMPKDYMDITLTVTGNEDLDKKLTAMGNTGQSADLLKENDYFRFSAIDRKRQKHNQALRELTDAIVKRIFPCYVPSL